VAFDRDLFERLCFIRAAEGEWRRGEEGKMITEALRIMLFGMAGIFIVMGLIIAGIKVLGRIGGNRKASAG
jgi:hypothetical protein